MIAENTHHHLYPDLRGKRILLVEDEYYIADDMCRLLEAAGATVIGPVSTLEMAHRRIDEEEFDCAVLDLNLHGENAVCIADKIAASGRAFVLATGYGSPSVPDRLKDAPRIEKTFEPAALLDLIARIPCAHSVG